MKFTKQDLLTLLIGLFLFASCKNPDSVGLDVDPSTAITGTLVTSEVRSETIAEPAANTQSLTRYPLGYMVDPVFGTTKSSVAMTVTPSSLSYDFGTSPVLDSAILVLRIDTTTNKFYGDTTSSQYSIDVYQLTNKVTTYKSSDVQAHNAQLLGNVKKKLYPNTPFKVTDVVTGKTDTLKTVKAQIRIPLDKAFIQSQILSLPTTGTSTNAKFVDYFKGLYAEVNKNTSTGVGGVAFINLNNSYLQLVYKKTSSTSGIDTVSVNFPVSTTSAAAATIVHDYTGTNVDTQLKNPPTSSPSPYTVTYTQGLAGVKTKISFPLLDAFTGTYGKVVVNKAELVVDLSAGTYAYPFTPIQRLSLYRWDIANQPTTTPDYSSTSPGVIGGYYDSLKNRYIFIVTNYVQGLIDKTVKDYGTFIAPTGLDAFQVVPTAITAERSVLGATTNTTNKVKLNIYYTKIN
ncbi:DUF4270 domain-containing protein [Pedobacter sp. HDW13]|uniref:DUF4270 domain-containing protein n=1 Tax=unclassified Pedobacter TaxID=2628915 RepID=UPI000F59D304|nr:MULTISPECIES: DUF4270 domain-containing protein [unclassified Pedobacter]QIL39711.1 DUF4270 domain-containing protein [Pedobacter sp. HDW13]RQO79808.1 DUF4270 domain-containing protein [Pedobacter sp. KBW01]